MKADDAGDVFPLWGTCLGFQFLSVSGAGGQNVLSPVDGEDYTIPLNLSDGMSYSHLFHTSDANIGAMYERPYINIFKKFSKVQATYRGETFMSFAFFNWLHSRVACW